MATEVYVGETVRITAQDLNHASEGPVTTGATVNVSLYDPAGVLLSSNGAIADGDDWYVDIEAPATPGQYLARVEAIKSGAVFKDKLYVTVRPF